MKSINVLTDKQEIFAREYFSNRNKLEAFRIAGYSMAGDARARADAVYQNSKVQIRLAELADEAAAVSGVSIERVLHRFYEIATADPSELINLRIGCCRYCYGVGGEYHWRKREYLEALRKVEHANKSLPESRHLPLPDVAGGFGFNPTLSPNIECEECFGEGEQRVVPSDTSKLSGAARMLYAGVKTSRNGVEIMTIDQQKALENVTRILGGFKDGFTLTGKVETVKAAIGFETTDAEEAARLYQEFIGGAVAKK